jgi:RNA polymerase sigma-70 factor (ECF subfamily)
MYSMTNILQNDDDLVKEFLNGNQHAFNLLARKYQEKIYWHARRMVGTHDDADEILQQVLIVMYKKLGSFNFQSSLYTWIYKITSTRSLNLIKKNNIKRFVTIHSDDADNLRSNEDVFKKIEEKERFMKMQKLLQKLPAKQREVFVLRNFDEMSYEEISQVTGKSTGALKANYFHAFNKLKELMKENE